MKFTAKKSAMEIKFMVVFVTLLSLNPVSLAATQDAILKEFNELLGSLVNNDTGLFDGMGSLDAAVWLRDDNGIKPVFMKSFGKSQIRNVSVEISKLNTMKPSEDLQKIADKYMPKIQDVAAKDGGQSYRNQYRIASITKTFIGLAANLLKAKHGLNLDEKVSPTYVNLTTLGMAHGWNNPAASSSSYRSPNFPNATRYIDSITFRHLLTHTSGLSRESKKGDMYGYGSSRTHTSRCPPEDQYQGQIDCSKDKDNNWRAWIQHVVSYMMPACGCSDYNEESSIASCLPGQYYHYSNAAYSILGLSLDSFIKQKVNASTTLEDWITENVMSEFKMNDTVFTWVDYNQEQKSRTTHGCYGGKDNQSCDQKRALRDYGDRGMKTPPGGIWTTTTDLARYLLSVPTLSADSNSNIINGDSKIHPMFDDKSEEDPSHMPLQQFKYGHGWYIAKKYTCLQSGKGEEHFIGAWGTVPGFTSYAITNPKGDASKVQYAVSLVRSYNYAGRLNLGNQARRLLWRLLHKDEKLGNLSCPVQVFDDFPTGDKLNDGGKPSSATSKITSGTIIFTVLLFWTVNYAT